MQFEEATDDDELARERGLLLLRSAAEVERKTLLANVVGTILIVGFAQWLPNASDFYLALVLRFVALFSTALLYEKIRARLAANGDIEPLMRLATGMTFFAGISWAALVVPVFLEPVLHPSSFIVTVGVFVSVALVITSTATLKGIALAFAAGFLAAFLTGLFFAPPELALWLGIGLGFIMGAIGIFAIGAARHQRESANIVVRNQLLTEDLEEALAQAEFLAVRDPLTGLYNRRALFEDKIYEQTPGDRHHVLIIDLDHFKEVNDRFGHDMGDRVLIGVARVFRDFLRELPGEGHLAARLGGEEFALVLAIADDDEADRVTMALQEAINRVPAGLGLPENLGTASIGMSHLNRGEKIGEALQRADKALYGAKKDGRNRVRREAA